MRTSLSVSAFTLACLAATVNPASAATISSLQSQLNTALLGIPQATSTAVNGEATINTTSRRITRDGDVGKGLIHFTWNQRAQKSPDLTAANSEGRIVLDTFTMQTTGGTSSALPPLSLDTPMALQWRIVDKTFYGRVEKLPDSISSFLDILGIDSTKLVGQWTSLNSEDATATAMSLPTASITDKLTSGLPTLEQLGALESLRSTPILLVRSVEKKWTDADGHSLARLRARINPAIVTGLLRLETARIAVDDPDRAMKLKDLNTQFAKIRKALPGLQLAVNLDLTTGSIVRIELGGVSVSPQQACTWNFNLDKETCHNATMLTVRYSIGISFMKETGPMIEAPLGAIPLKDLFPAPPPQEETTDTDMTWMETTTTNP